MGFHPLYHPINHVFFHCSNGGATFTFMYDIDLINVVTIYTRVSMEVSKWLVSWCITYSRDLQPTYMGVIIHVLITMDVPVDIPWSTSAPKRWFLLYPFLLDTFMRLIFIGKMVGVLGMVPLYNNQPHTPDISSFEWLLGGVKQLGNHAKGTKHLPYDSYVVQACEPESW